MFPTYNQTSPLSLIDSMWSIAFYVEPCLRHFKRQSKLNLPFSLHVSHCIIFQYYLDIFFLTEIRLPFFSKTAFCDLACFSILCQVAIMKDVFICPGSFCWTDRLGFTTTTQTGHEYFFKLSPKSCPCFKNAKKRCVYIKALGIQRQEMLFPFGEIKNASWRRWPITV